MELDQRLNLLKNDLETFIVLGNPVNPDRLPLGLNVQQTVYIQCTYHSIMIDIHNTLTYPWSRNVLGLPPDRFVQSQVEKSFAVIADTCRNSMLTLQHVHIDAATPLPLVPMLTIFCIDISNVLKTSKTCLFHPYLCFYQPLHLRSDGA